MLGVRLPSAQPIFRAVVLGKMFIKMTNYQGTKMLLNAKETSFYAYDEKSIARHANGETMKLKESLVEIEEKLEAIGVAVE